MDTRHFGSDVKSLSWKKCWCQEFCWFAGGRFEQERMPFWSGYTLFCIPGVDWTKVMLRSCRWNVTWFASRVRPSCFSDLSDGPAGCTHPPTMTFSSASFNTAPLSIVPTSCTAVFPGRRNLACGAGHNVSRLRRWWWQWRWQWWQRPLPTRSTLLSSVSTQNPLTFPEIFFVATQGSHIEFTYLGCHS